MSDTAAWIAFFALLALAVLPTWWKARQAWKQAPLPKGEELEVVVSRSGQELQLVSQRTSPIDGHVLGWYAQSHWGTKYNLPADLSVNYRHLY